MFYLDNYPKNSEIFVCMALDGRLYGFDRKGKRRTKLFNTLKEVWTAIDNPMTEWIAFC